MIPGVRRFFPPPNLLSFVSSPFSSPLDPRFLKKRLPIWWDNGMCPSPRDPILPVVLTHSWMAISSYGPIIGWFLGIIWDVRLLVVILDLLRRSMLGLRSNSQVILHACCARLCRHLSYVSLIMYHALIRTGFGKSHTPHQ
jgi:hypothetical protein